MNGSDEQQAGELTGALPPHPLWDIQERQINGRTWVPLSEVYTACGYQGGGGTSTGLERIRQFGAAAELQKVEGSWWVSMAGLRLAAASMCKVEARAACATFIEQRQAYDLATQKARQVVEEREEGRRAVGLLRLARRLVDSTLDAATQALVEGDDDLAMSLRDLYLDQERILVCEAPSVPSPVPPEPVPEGACGVPDAG